MRYNLVMKLYLSSIDIPTPSDLAELLSKPLGEARVAIIANAIDYYSTRAWNYKAAKYVRLFESLGAAADIVDLREYSEPEQLGQTLARYELVWVTGGNTFCVRHEMRRSGFESVIAGLLESGMVYGGDSAGALVAGQSIEGIESADVPEFAESVINEGLKLVPYVVLPHVDNPEFAEAVETVERLHAHSGNVIRLKDSQAVVFKDGKHRVVDGPEAT